MLSIHVFSKHRNLHIVNIKGLIKELESLGQVYSYSKNQKYQCLNPLCLPPLNSFLIIQQ